MSTRRDYLFSFSDEELQGELDRRKEFYREGRCPACCQSGYALTCECESQHRKARDALDVAARIEREMSEAFSRVPNPSWLSLTTPPAQGGPRTEPVTDSGAESGAEPGVAATEIEDAEVYWICPGCGTEHGYAMGTGDCGCECNCRPMTVAQYYELFGDEGGSTSFKHRR